MVRFRFIYSRSAEIIQTFTERGREAQFNWKYKQRNQSPTTTLNQLTSARDKSE